MQVKAIAPADLAGRALNFYHGWEKAGKARASTHAALGAAIQARMEAERRKGDEERRACLKKYLLK